ncbi:hypothetical protein B0H13DRAFT_2440706 [Mycena leptocephala]|nr:hypothetical protein B0H13DRAFT_2440706 [Mycena leptocephala]
MKAIDLNGTQEQSSDIWRYGYIPFMRPLLRNLHGVKEVEEAVVVVGVGVDQVVVTVVVDQVVVVAVGVGADRISRETAPEELDKGQRAETFTGGSGGAGEQQGGGARTPQGPRLVEARQVDIDGNSGKAGGRGGDAGLGKQRTTGSSVFSNASSYPFQMPGQSQRNLPQTTNFLTAGASAARGTELDSDNEDNKTIAAESEPADPQHHTLEAEPQISTFVIFTPDDLAAFARPSSNETTTLRAEDWHALNEKGLVEGGTTFSVHSPDAATAWVEAHYEHPLLVAMRSNGLGGPIAAMLSPEVEALAVFGSIGETWVLDSAQVLSRLSQFTILVRPITDDPVLKWKTEASDSNTGSEPLGSGEIERRPGASTENDVQMDDRDGNSGDPRLSPPNTADEGGENQDVDMDILAADTDQNGNRTDSSEGSGSEDGPDHLESSGSGMFRLRGGAGKGDVDYTPWLSPVHDVDVNLKICPRPDITYYAAIRSKIQFKVQHKYEDKYRNGYRPQVISWTRFMVASNRFEVRPDRSYSSIGFLVHGHVDCGFEQPNHTTKVTETETKQNIWTANVVGGAHPTGGITYGRNKSKARAIENLNDRITPKCPVYCDDGGFWMEDGNHYVSFNVSYESTADPMDVKKGIKHPLKVEFSMGINIVNREDPNDYTLPDIAFISRNQTMLWISDGSLKAKTRGIVILTCLKSSIPDVQTIDQLAIVEEQAVNLQRSETIIPDETPAKYNASLSLLVGEIDVSKNKPNLLKQILNKVIPNYTPEPHLIDLPLHEFKARGWDVSMNKWRQPVYPALDTNFRNATDGPAIWNLIATGKVHKSTEEVDQPGNMPGSDKECETVATEDPDTSTDTTIDMAK